MHTCKILCLLALGLFCVNARVIKRQKKVRQRPSSSSCCLPAIDVPCKSILEPTYGGFGTCNCQNIFLDELSYGCGCKYVETYGVLTPEVSNYDRVPAIKMPKAIASYDAGISVPAINLPGLYNPIVDLPCSCQAIPPCVMDLSCSCHAMPSYVMDLPCSCQAIPPYVMDMPCSCHAIPPYVMDLPCSCQAIPPCVMDISCSCQPLPSYQIIETPCCRAMPPIVDYPCDIPSPMLTVPFSEPCCPPCKCQQIIKLPSCRCPTPQIDCCSKQMPCACQNVITCDNGYKVSYGLPCGCQNPLNCGCQSVVQLPAPCCQACQLPAVELPVYGYGCQSLPPPEIGCGGKYLRQVTLQPPFL